MGATHNLLAPFTYHGINTRNFHTPFRIKELVTKPLYIPKRHFLIVGGIVLLVLCRRVKAHFLCVSTNGLVLIPPKFSLF